VCVYTRACVRARARVCVCLCVCVCVVSTSGLREFKLFELEAATSNFSHDNIIGRGGGSIVYKVRI